MGYSHRSIFWPLDANIVSSDPSKTGQISMGPLLNCPRNIAYLLFNKQKDQNVIITIIAIVAIVKN